jgi:hypothetical protein
MNDVWHPQILGTNGWTEFGGEIIGSLATMVAHGEHLYAAGSFTSIGQLKSEGLARWDGAQWSALGGGLHGGRVSSLAFVGDEIYAGGSFTNAGGLNVSGLAKWDGSQWLDVGGGVHGERPVVFSLALHQGALYVGGYFSSVGEGLAATNIARWDSSGWHAVDQGLPAGIPPVVVLHSTGETLFAGLYKVSPGVMDACIQAFDGQAWNAVGDPAQPVRFLAQAYSMQSYRGQLYVSGAAVYLGTTSISTGALRWDGVIWTPTNLGVSPAQALIVSHDKVYASGLLRTPVSGKKGGVAVFDGQKTATIGSGVNLASRANEINASAVLGDKLFLAGSFRTRDFLSGKKLVQWDGTDWTNCGIEDNLQTAAKALATDGRVLYLGGTTNGGILRVDGTNVTTLGGGLPPAYNNGDPTVCAILTAGEEIYIGGNFGVARWTGDHWEPLGDTFAGTVLALVYFDQRLYAGGEFQSIANQSAAYLAEWTGAAWKPLEAELDGSVRVLESHGGSLYVGGKFKRAGSVQLNGIGKWNGTDWSPLGQGFGGGQWVTGQVDESQTVVNAMVFAPDGRLFAGGCFTLADGNDAQKVAQWDGIKWKPLGSGIALGRMVTTMAIYRDALYVSGPFGMAGGKASSMVAAWLGLNPAPTFHSVRFKNGACEVDFVTTLGNQYSLESRESLGDNRRPWQTGQTISGTGQLMTLSVPVDGMSRFIRLRRE